MSQPGRSPRADAHPSSTASRHLPAALAVALLSLLLAAPCAASAAPLVVIDAGHGGIYNHASYGRLKEKHVNLWMSLELRKILQAKGFGVGMTRTRDKAVNTANIPTWAYSSGTGLWSYRPDGRRFGDPPLDDLQARANIANTMGADLFVSIHNNGARSRRANGTETWASPNDPLGISLSRYVQRAVVQTTRLRNRGSFVTDFYVNKWTNMPAVLVEGAFMSNRAEARKLSNAFFRRNLVRGIALGIERWLATNPYTRLYPRYDGATTADVAAAASAAGWPTGSRDVLLTSSTDYSRALACAPLARALAAPLLFADAGGVPAATLAELARLRPASITVLGDATALPDGIVATAASAAGTPTVERIVGADRVEAAALIADRLLAPTDATIVIASADSYSDVLSASAYAAANRVPLLLTEPGAALSPAARAFVDAHTGEMTRTVVFGPPGGIADSALAGLPNVVRLAGDDMFQANALALRAAYPAPAPVYAYVVSPTGADALVAAVAAANTPGGVVVLNAGRVLSPWTREWLSNMRGRTSGLTIVGGEAAQPTLVDRMIEKARR
jgi:N-acetylmuramoyl-L-alanine amidase